MPRRRMLLHWGSWQLRASSRTSACTRASGRVGHKHQSCCSRYSANYNYNNYNSTTDFNEVEHHEFRRVPDMSMRCSYSLAIFGMRRDLRRKMPRRRMLLHWRSWQLRASSRTSACTRASRRVGQKHQSCCSRCSANYNNYNNTTAYNEVEHHEFRRVPDMSMRCSYSLAIFGMRRDLRRKMPRRRMLLQ